MSKFNSQLDYGSISYICSMGLNNTQLFNNIKQLFKSEVDECIPLKFRDKVRYYFQKSNECDAIGECMWLFSLNNNAHKTWNMIVKIQDNEFEFEQFILNKLKNMDNMFMYLKPNLGALFFNEQFKNWETYIAYPLHKGINTKKYDFHGSTPRESLLKACKALWMFEKYAKKEINN